MLGGVTSLAGGALKALAANAINAGVGTSTTVGTCALFQPHLSIWSFVVSGLIQGTIAGAGTGLATGFAGGKGSAETMLKSMADGALWGGALGGLMGLAMGAVITSGKIYVNFFNIIEKFGKGGSFWGRRGQH